MTEFALVRDGAFAEFRDLPAKPDSIVHKNIVWCTVVDNRLPFDRATQTRDDDPPAIDLQAETYTLNGTVRALTAQELDARNQARADMDIDRAFASVLIDEFNRHSLRINAILDAINTATNLAGVKSAVGLINNIPSRTADDLKNAIKAKL